MESWKYIKTLLKCLHTAKDLALVNGNQYLSRGDNYMQLHGLVNVVINLQLTIKSAAREYRYTFLQSERKLMDWDASAFERFIMSQYVANVNMHELPFD